MGQQQLLLLVLSTVIVGLATVAGIQAFSENQAQASQDALVQRGTSIASDIQGLAGKPTQMGGVELTSSGASASQIVERLGYETDGSDDKVAAEGAGNSGQCQIGTPGSNSVTITCSSDDAPQDVEVTVSPGNSAGNVISTSFTSS
ncbi:type IV secretory pathway TrbL component [Salinibacter ruber]|uniref:hypothetical protein n=1 Tax=Salinibacter ruber TaxID=146919 RepID=UPI002169FA48|nr:hypothetical protein [Salinibacter ruber]MCS4194082.1 type IV secretory pathway TrbL component [Salinibacter ruber]